MINSTHTVHCTYIHCTCVQSICVCVCVCVYTVGYTAPHNRSDSFHWEDTKVSVTDSLYISTV